MVNTDPSSGLLPGRTKLLPGSMFTYQVRSSDNNLRSISQDT